MKKRGDCPNGTHIGHHHDDCVDPRIPRCTICSRPQMWINNEEGLGYCTEHFIGRQLRFMSMYRIGSMAVARLERLMKKRAASKVQVKSKNKFWGLRNFDPVVDVAVKRTFFRTKQRKVSRGTEGEGEMPKHFCDGCEIDTTEDKR